MGSFLTKDDDLHSYDYSCGSITISQLISRARAGDVILI